eukprot:TRINITY_DN109809_c0_g1_i1.p1 TRINITY_DN109809_c0_g1~~TRINITY_DN109809_c0_g1_i1.p1  ORF type:complete len:101 (-),score=12.53 TRINITY_DN109809_c0_g1_i1:71-373(-)
MLILFLFFLQANADLFCGDKNCYDVLGVSRTADTSEIKKAYRRLSLQYHPDRPEGSAELFRPVANAYEILVDPETRREYDDVLAHPEDFIRNQYTYYRHR